MSEVIGAEIRELGSRDEPVKPDSLLLLINPDTPNEAYKVYFSEFCRAFDSVALGPARSIQGVGRIGQSLPHNKNKYYFTEGADWDALVPGTIIDIDTAESYITKMGNRLLKEVFLDANFNLEVEAEFGYIRPYFAMTSHTGANIMTTGSGDWVYDGVLNLLRDEEQAPSSIPLTSGLLIADSIKSEGALYVDALFAIEQQTFTIDGTYYKVHSDPDVDPPIKSTLTIEIIDGLTPEPPGANLPVTFNCGIDIQGSAGIRVSELSVDDSVIGTSIGTTITDINFNNLVFDYGGKKSTGLVSITTLGGTKEGNLIHGEGLGSALKISPDAVFDTYLEATRIAGHRDLAGNKYGGIISTSDTPGKYIIPVEVYNEISEGADFIIDNNFYPITVTKKSTSNNTVEFNFEPHLPDGSSTFNYIQNVALDKFALEYASVPRVLSIQSPIMFMTTSEYMTYDLTEDNLLTNFPFIGQDPYHKPKLRYRHLEMKPSFILDRWGYRNGAIGFNPGCEGEYIFDLGYDGLLEQEVGQTGLARTSYIEIGIAKKEGQAYSEENQYCRVETQRKMFYWPSGRTPKYYFSCKITMNITVKELSIDTTYEPFIRYKIRYSDSVKRPGTIAEVHQLDVYCYVTHIS